MIAMAMISNSYAESTSMAELNLKIHNVITFKKTEKEGVFKKLTEVSTTTISLIADGETSSSTRKSVNRDFLTYTLEKGLINIHDQRVNLYTDVPVIIQKSLMGRMKSFKIAGDDYENAYFDSYKISGLVSLRDLDFKKDERKSMVVGDQVCSIERSSDLVTCEQDLTLHVAQYKTILMATVFLLQLTF